LLEYYESPEKPFRVLLAVVAKKIVAAKRKKYFFYFAERAIIFQH